MKKMKKLIVMLLTLAMVMSMFSVAGAADETTLLTGAGGVSVSSIESYEVLKINVKATDETVTNQGWGVGGICFDGWSVADGFGITSNGDVEQSFEFSVAAILAAAEGVETLNFNAYNGFAIVSVVGIAAGDAPVGVQLKGAGNGGVALATIATYDTIVVTIQADDESELKNGWGLGGMVDSAWAVVDGLDITSTGVATQKHTFKVSDILEAYEELELSTVNFNIYNGYSLVEVRGFVAEKDELEPNVTYKQTAGNNVRFVQLISEEYAQNCSQVTYTVSYNGAVKATLDSVECYSAVSVAGDTLTAPEGYVFVACAVTNVPDVELVTCEISFTEIEQ